MCNGLNDERIREAASLFGRLGGKSRSPAKIEAGRRNAAKARAARLAKRVPREKENHE